MKNIQVKIKTYLKKRDWDKNEPVDLSKSLMIEGAELLELFQWDSPKREEILKNKKLMEDIKGELADIFIYAFGMAVSLNLNAETVVLDKLKKLDKKYPPNVIKANRDNYLKIKKAHRK